MLLSELLHRGAILLDLKGSSTEDALGEIVDGLILAGCLGADERERALINLLKREAVATTGLGEQCAIPHAKVDFVPDFVGAFAYSRNGVDFRSTDGRDVKYLFLLLSPVDDPYGHLRLLGTIATLLRQEGFLASLARSTGVDEVIRRVAEAEAAAFQD